MKLNFCKLNFKIDEDLFFVANIQSEVNVNLMSFSLNNITGHVFNVFQIKILKIIYLIYDKNNNNSSNSGGGFLRSYNTNEKFLREIIVLNSFSDKTTVGIKLIDDLDLKVHGTQALNESTV